MKKKLLHLGGISIALLTSGLLSVNAQQKIKLTIEPVVIEDYYQLCSDFFVKKTNDHWTVVDSGNIADADYEYLKGCFVQSKVDSGALDFYIQLNARKGCLYRSGIPVQGPKLRSEAYYQCNSNFAKLNIFGGGFSRDEPINMELLKKAIESPSVQQIAEKAFVRAMSNISEDAAKKGGHVEYYLERYSPYLTRESQVQIAEKHIANNDNIHHKKIVLELLDPETISRLDEENKNNAYTDYIRQVNTIFKGNPSEQEIWSFKNRKPLTKASRWSEVDFDDMVSKYDSHVQRMKDAEQNRINEYLANFRKAIRVGSSTHCGYVIEIRQPMIKLALNTPLAGYTNEPWIKTAEAFPPEYGCTNSNGRLSTYR